MIGSSSSIGGKKTLKAASQGVGFTSLFLEFFVGDKKKVKIQRTNILDISGSFEDQRRAGQPLGMEILVTPCRVNGKRHIRTRPMFPMWEVRGEFDTSDDDLTLPRLREMFTLAGTKAGLGDWRPGSPSKPGAYGRFTAKVE